MDMSTFTWLKESLTPVSEDIELFRAGRPWKAVSGMRACGSILCIYKDDLNYCAHSSCDEVWMNEEDPSLGYYDINLSWDDLIKEIADKYDNIRNKT